MLEQARALSLVRGQSWHHDFEIIPGVRTQGNDDPSAMRDELNLPADMTGSTLADVGASNGFFSFQARQRGAKVVSFDFRNKDNSGFGLAQHINGLSDIEHHQVNVLDLDAKQYGQFDTVLALGLPQHISDPYLALANCAALSRSRLLVESYCIDPLLAPEVAAQPIMRFIYDAQRFPARGQPNADPSNFWGFTAACLASMVEDVGFEVKTLNVRGDRVLIDAQRAMDASATRQGIAYGQVPHQPVSGDPNDPKNWRVF